MIPLEKDIETATCSLTAMGLSVLLFISGSTSINDMHRETNIPATDTQ
jgi:hypothetical protein